MSHHVNLSVMSGKRERKAFRGQGVKGRAVKWGGLQWTVSGVAPDGTLGLRRESRGRLWQAGFIPREAVTFVRHNYEVRA